MPGVKQSQLDNFIRDWKPTSFGGELPPDRSCQFSECGERALRGSYCNVHAAVMYSDKQSAEMDE
tara:strand:- start:343 stop:537 length:195 start_codon:yes stop_codon:yes gene_type:complete